MERLWTKPFVQLTLGTLVLFMSFYLLLPTLPLYITQLGGSELHVGLASGIFTLAAVMFRPVVGTLLDRYGRRPFILWGMLGFVLSMLLYNWAGAIAILLALRIFHGVSWAFSTTAVGTSVTDVIPPSRRGEGMGWFGVATTAAMAVGPMIGIWIIDNRSFRDLFILAAGLSAVALLLAVSTRTAFQPKAAQRLELFDRATLPVTVTLFFLTVSYGGVMTFLPLFAQSIEVNAGTFFLIFAVTLTLTRPFAGKLSDRLGESIVIMTSLFITIAALIVLMLTNGWTGVIASAVLYGIGFGSAQPALQAAILRITQPERRGVATASFMTAFDLGIGLGSIALGWISQRAGYEVLFAVCAASVAVSLIIFAILARRLLPRRQPALGR
jgi:Arabinose efflux permease